MVTRTRKENAAGKRRKVKLNDLKLNKETVKDLSTDEQEQIKGGRAGRTLPWLECGTQIYPGGPCGAKSQLDCI